MNTYNPQNLNYLFEKTHNRGFRKYIRCENCVHAEKRLDLPSNYIHCTKYTNMISLCDKTCKSAELRK